MTGFDPARLVAEALKAKPEKDGDTARRFRLEPFRSIKASTAPQYLVKGFVPLTGLTVVWGPPKCGKAVYARRK
jgi:hypothetical protein